MKYFGQQFSHHGELIQGIFIENGESKKALITLKSNQWKSLASYETQGPDGLEIFPSHKVKALNAARLACAKLSIPAKGTVIIVESPPEQIGLGSSTADILAVIYAIEGSAGKHLSQEEVLFIASQSETGTDSVMYKNAVLFDFKNRVVIEDFKKPLPSFFIAGFNADKKGGVFYFPANYPMLSEEDAARYDSMRKRLRSAINSSDRKELASLATESAYIRQKYAPKPNWNEILELHEESRALGIQIAHSGMVVGLMFADKQSAEKAKELASRHGFSPWVCEVG